MSVKAICGWITEWQQRMAKPLEPVSSRARFGRSVTFMAKSTGKSGDGDSANTVAHVRRRAAVRG